MVGQQSNDQEKVNAQNWLDLASHFKDKVLKRTSELSYLHTRAGFLIAGAVISLQVMMAFKELKNPVMATVLLIAVLSAIGSLVMAIISMHNSKSTTPLNPDDMILTLTGQPLSREDFGNWLAKSYALANKSFNEEYNKKYNQQVWSGILLVISLVISIILKGLELYVQHK